MLFLTGFLGLLMAGLAAGVVPSDTAEDEDSPTEDDPLCDTGRQAAPVEEGAGDPPEDTETTLPGVDPVVPAPSPEATEEADILWGDLFGDLIDGAEGDDQINGYDGDDSLSGAEGDDTLVGAAGDDRLEGGAGDDSLCGEAGDDTLEGAAGDDTVAAGFGADSVAGGAGADSLSGGADADSLSGDAGDDCLEGNDGDDTLTGGLGTDELSGGNGDDVLIGVAPGDQSGNSDADGQDFLNGGVGADTLMVGSGDWASGGEEGDLFALGEWIHPDAPATITDYDSRADQIVVVYDPDSGVAPEVTVEPAETEGNAWIMLNGVRLAEVVDAGDLQPSDVLLITPAEFAAV